MPLYGIGGDDDAEIRLGYEEGTRRVVFLGNLQAVV